MDKSQTPDLNLLSEREQEILRFVATGVSNKEIARQLYISANTVRVHLRNIFIKIGVTTRTEAAMYAVHTGLVPSIEVSVSGGQREEPAREIDKTVSVPRWRYWWVAGVGLILVIGLLGLGSRLVARQETPTATAMESLAIDESRWHRLADMPTARDGLAIAAYANQIYVMAGETTGGVTGVVERYDPALNTWEERSSMPLPVADVKAEVIGGQIYIPGGRTASGDVTDVLEIYDPRQDIWEQGAHLPLAVSAYALATFEGRLYLFGGWDGQHYLDTVFIYSPDTENWSIGTSMPTARAYAGAAVAGGEIYVVGGEDQSGSLLVNEVYRPSLDRGDGSSWQVDESLPVSVSGIGVISVADLVYVVSGGQSDEGVYTLHNNLSDQRKSWQFLPMPFEFGGRFSVVILGTRLYIMGGYLGDRQLSLNVSYEALYTIMLPIVP
jgi:DNA-binding CsgD family transcriptional regulator